jgi:hypothetical protein
MIVLLVCLRCRYDPRPSRSCESCNDESICQVQSLHPTQGTGASGWLDAPGKAAPLEAGYAVARLARRSLTENNGKVERLDPGNRCGSSHILRII